MQDELLKKVIISQDFLNNLLNNSSLLSNYCFKFYVIPLNDEIWNVKYSLEVAKNIQAKRYPESIKPNQTAKNVMDILGLHDTRNHLFSYCNKNDFLLFYRANSNFKNLPNKYLIEQMCKAYKISENLFTELDNLPFANKINFVKLFINVKRTSEYLNQQAEIDSAWKLIALSGDKEILAEYFNSKEIQAEFKISNKENCFNIRSNEIHCIRQRLLYFVILTMNLDALKYCIESLHLTFLNDGNNNIKELYRYFEKKYQEKNFRDCCYYFKVIRTIEKQRIGRINDFHGALKSSEIEAKMLFDFYKQTLQLNEFLYTINTRIEDKTAIQIATEKGHVLLVRELINEGVNTNTNSWLSLLDVAIDLGNDQLVSVFVKAGLCINARARNFPPNVCFDNQIVIGLKINDEIINRKTPRFEKAITNLAELDKAINKGTLFNNNILKICDDLLDESFFSKYTSDLATVRSIKDKLSRSNQKHNLDGKSEVDESKLAFK